MGSDLSICNAARVSFHKQTEAVVYIDETTGDVTTGIQEKDAKLLSYLAKHNHWSPFAHSSLSFRIKAPIFVARQLGKHQVGLVWNEVSRRYVDEEPEYYFPTTWRGRPSNAKQGSEGIVDLDSDMSNYDDYYSPEAVCEFADKAYDKMITAGVAPEQARMILPQNTMTEWVWTGSLMAFARVCKQRLDSHAQQETQEIAQQITKLIPKDFEQSWKVLIDN